MTAMPPTLEEALNFQGYLIKRQIIPQRTIALPTGTMSFPEMALARLVYQYDDTPELGDDLYISNIPIFHDNYRVYLTSKILDRFRDRRISADTQDVWAMWLIEWANEKMGYFNQRYLSSAVALPLDTQSTTRNVSRDEETTGNTSKDSSQNDRSRHVDSDFPQSQLAGDTDYASTATDANAESIGVEATSAEEARAMTELETTAGRQGISVAELLMKQREAFLNVDTEVLDSMSVLFLHLFDQDEYDDNAHPDFYAVY